MEDAIDHHELTINCFTAQLHSFVQVRGCWVLLVGDYHYSDIKVVRGGDSTALRYYPTLGRMPTPLYQVLDDVQTRDKCMHETCPQRAQYT